MGSLTEWKSCLLVSFGKVSSNRTFAPYLASGPKAQTPLEAKISYINIQNPIVFLLKKSADRFFVLSKIDLLIVDIFS